jgi:hypothetical protein
MSAPRGLVPFEYAVVRVVPRVDRGEVINAGVILYSQAADYLGCRTRLDRARLACLDPGADAEAVDRALAQIAATCAGDGAGAEEAAGRRFRWLTAPRSTVVQPGPVHTGLTAAPAAELDRLTAALVDPVGGRS